MAIYYIWSGAVGSANGSSWANAFTNLTAAYATEAAGDTLYMAHDHLEATAGLTLTSSGTVASPTKVICVDRGGSVPPVPADRRTTAQVTTTGTGGFTIRGVTHFDGIIFSAGTGAGTANYSVANVSNLQMRFDNCSIRWGCTGGGFIDFAQSTITGVYVELNNTTFSFTAVGCTIVPYCEFVWRNTPSALLGTMPTVLLTAPSRGCNVEVIGVDLSAAGSGKTIVGSIAHQSNVFKFMDCKLDASVTKTATPTTRSFQADFIRSGASGNYSVHRTRLPGTLDEELTIVRTGGASDGTTPIAWKIVTTASCTYTLPFECPPIAIWNETTGSAVTATIEGIGAALPTDKEVWVEVEYLSDASSPQGSFVSDAADLVATAANQTSSSETWGGSTAAFKLAVTFTPQQKGWLYGRVRVGKASSTVYVDPKITLS